jgi:hypothetical protein
LCEGCSNVAHPECAGLSGIPDGDWYCPRCVKEKGLTSAIQPSSGDNVSKAPESGDSLAEIPTKPSSEPADSTTNANETENEEKKAEVEEQSKDALAEVDLSTETSNDNPRTDDTKQDEKPPAEPKQAVPPPEITDEEFEAKESELEQLIETLSSQHEAPKPKPKKQKEQAPESEEEEPEESSKKRGRPRKNDGKNSKKSGRRRGGGGADELDDAIEALSAAARSFLESVSISTGEQFLAAPSTRLGNDLIKWRKKQGMPPLKGSGHIATISGWKTIVRNAGGVEYLSDGLEEFAEVVPENKPRSRSSIEKRTAAATKSPLPKGRKRQRSKSPARPTKVPRSDNPIENLPVQGQNFCEYLKIIDAEDFLAQRTSELAEELVKFRKKAKMPVLAGSGPSAYVAMWKTQLRRDVAYQKSLQEERNARGRNVKRGSKVQDVEEASQSGSPETKRIRRNGTTPKNNKATSITTTATSAAAAMEAEATTKPAAAKGRGKPKNKPKEEENESAVVFNVLEETKKLAEEEEEEDLAVETSGRRRRLRTNRYAPN